MTMFFSQVSVRRQTARLREIPGFALYALRRFQIDGGLSMASALSYTSLLAIVPLLAIALAMLAAFPAFDPMREQLQATLFQNLVPEVGMAVLKWVRNFVENAGRLTTAGIVGLSFTAIMLLVTIEGSLNIIFRVATDRGPLSRLLVYWTSLTLGPLLIGASLSLTGYLTAVRRWSGSINASQFVEFVTALLPTTLSFLAFSLIYLAVPNRKVQLRDALLGGVVAALLFAALRWGFAYYVSSAKTYQSVYGALSALPIFLIWMYVSWSAVLLGAEVTAGLPEWRLGRRKVLGHVPARRRLGAALQVLSVLFEAAQEGRKVGRRELLDRTTHDERRLVSVLDLLVTHQFVARLRGQRFVLARDLSAVTLKDLVACLDLGLVPDDAEGLGEELGDRLRARIKAASDAADPAMGISLRDLLRE